jgi:hypothetical protein
MALTVLCCVVGIASDCGVCGWPWQRSALGESELFLLVTSNPLQKLPISAAFSWGKRRMLQNLGEKCRPALWLENRLNGLLPNNLMNNVFSTANTEYTYFSTFRLWGSGNILLGCGLDIMAYRFDSRHGHGICLFSPVQTSFGAPSPSWATVKLLKPRGLFTYHQVEHSKFYMVLALRSVFCADLRTDSGLCCIHH